MIIILWTRTTTSTAKNYVSYVFLVIPSSTSSTRATLYWGQRCYTFDRTNLWVHRTTKGQPRLRLWGDLLGVDSFQLLLCCCTPEDRQQTWTCYFRLFVGNRVSGISQINFEIFQRVPRGFGSLSVIGSEFPGRQRL